VEALRLQADELVDKPGVSAHLFAQLVSGEGTLACLERLRARLGEGAVQALGEQADHRPECATCHGDATATAGLPSSSSRRLQGQGLKPSGAGPIMQAIRRSRPLWLLPTPQALTERAGSPHWHGPLKLLSRGERLESGWWDEGEGGAAGDVRRDYFVARNPLGQWAWVFRNAQGWFLHGIFA
jgi:protein ImuB